MIRERLNLIEAAVMCHASEVFTKKEAEGLLGIELSIEEWNSIQRTIDLIYGDENGDIDDIPETVGD